MAGQPRAAEPFARPVCTPSHCAPAVGGPARSRMAPQAAARQLAKTMAFELAPHGINVNVLQPGHVRTEGNPSTRPPASIPLGRLGVPRDVGYVAAFLCSAAADYITGSVVDVDGGYKVGMKLPR